MTVKEKNKTDIYWKTKESYDKGYEDGRSNALLNLPTCESCEYYSNDGFNYFGHCENTNVNIDNTVDGKFSCGFHSKIEQLRKDNDS